MSDISTAHSKSVNSPRQVLFASQIGTTIEFFDFYLCAAAMLSLVGLLATRETKDDVL